MSGVSPGIKPNRESTNPNHLRRRSQLVWKYLSNLLSVMSILFASVTTFWWFGSSNAFAAGGPPTSATLTQCTNGAVGPPIDAQPCVGSNESAVSVAIPGINGGASTSYKNWVTGSANGNNSHWSEGDFIAYRAAVSGLRSGEHTLVFTYDTVNTGLHAIDYLGSYDATETPSTTPTSVDGVIVNANNINPCADLMSSEEGQCDPTAPTSAMPIPAVQISGTGGEEACGGAPGTFTGAQEPGSMDLFGPAGSAISGISYLSQNVLSGTGTCTTTVQVTFTVPHNIGADKSIVIAWGGHIASEMNWGSGNAASSVNGAPYHMSLKTIDGNSAGSQDRSLQASAIYFLPTVSTVVQDDGSPISGTVAPGSTVRDTATLSGALSTASGTLNYLLFSNLTCSGEVPVSNQQVTVTNGVVPPSPTFVPSAGVYSYQAFYSGDSKDLPARSPCEPFAVGEAGATISTVVHNAGTGQPIVDPLPTGSTVYDSATISYDRAEVPTGTVTYTFYSHGTCTTGTVVGTPEVANVGSEASVPNSGNQGPLTSANGPYAFKASYSGDNNYLPGASDCETFSVGEGSISLATTIYLYNRPSSQPVEGPVPEGSKVYDTATLTYGEGPVPTGTVTYTLYSGGSDCVSGAQGEGDTVNVGSEGTVPNSAKVGPLNESGPYAFKVVYSGDENYPGGATICEPFSVGQELPTLTTTIYNSATNQPASSPLGIGSSIYDTAKLDHYSTIEPTGTVTYTFYGGGSDCESGTVIGSYNVSINEDGTVPNSPAQSSLTDTGGPYAFVAYYHGDDNFIDAYSPCEPLIVSAIGGESLLQAVPKVTTTVYDASTNLPIGSPLPLNATVYDGTAISISGGVDPTGTVTYTFFSNGNCVTGTVVGSPFVAKLGAHGTVPYSSNQGPLGAGSYAFRATYSGDANYVSVTSDCEPFTVAVPSLSITTSLSATRTIVGSPVHDSATLQGQTASAGGQATYSVYKDSSCTSFVQNVGTVNVTNGSVPDSPDVSFSSPGTYYFQVYYTGDGSNTPARSLCAAEVLTVDPVPVGAAQTGIAPVGGSHTAKSWPIYSLAGGVVAVLAAGILVRRRGIRPGIRQH